MRPPPSESAPSAPESPPEWSRDLLQQHGILSQGTSSRADVYCADVRREVLLLTLVKVSGPPLERSRPAELSVVDGAGVVRVRGVLQGGKTLRVNGVPQDVVFLAADPSSLRHVNRRSAFRVNVALKGEIAAFEPEELSRLSPAPPVSPNAGPAGQPSLQELARLVSARKRPCIVRDLSVGGARVAIEPPPLRAGQQVVMDVMLSRAEIVRNLPGRVVQGSSGGGGPFSALTRLRFDQLPAKLEIRLSRLVNEVQLESLRRGVRDRR